MSCDNPHTHRDLGSPRGLVTQGARSLAERASIVQVPSAQESLDMNPFPPNSRPQLIPCTDAAPRSGLAQYYQSALDEAGRGNLLAHGISIYLHLPFCPSRCLSCDHHSTVSHDRRDIDRYLDALEAEIELVTRRIGTARPLLQLHLGGGTPNYLTDPQLVRLMAMVERHFRILPETETSLEANPKRTSMGQLELLRGLGFKRIHFEIRDLDPDVQRALGRTHGPALLEDVFANARRAGFETLSMDLVYGLPGQSLDTIAASLEQVLQLAPDRIACFAFSRRADIFAHQRALDTASLPSLADKMVMINSVADYLRANGYVWIGLDCVARDRDSFTLAQAEQRLHRNWIGYTLHDNTDLIGFGTHAVSELGDLCVQNYPLIPDWAHSIQGGQLPIGGGVRMSHGDRERRRALNDLMCNLTLRDYAALRMRQGDALSALEELELQGIVDVRPDRVSVTPEGRFMLHQMWGDASPLYRWGGAW
jgi:oxygen-independent coproporphyrinogen-3 oxidase